MAADGYTSRALRKASWILAAVIMLGGTGVVHAPALAPVYPGPTPEAACGPGSKPEGEMQGRVSTKEVESGRAAKGYTCNTKELAHFGTVGGYKVERFLDDAGNECAYYDSTLLFPKDAVAAGQDMTGAYVLDMSDPANPVKTETLVSPAMQSPHESMSLNATRGLLVAITANPVFLPGFIDVYDLNSDCRHPVLKASLPVAGLGHESGFAPDGMTFYSASLDGGTVTAVDLSNTSAPLPIWTGQYRSHGLSISDDGNRAYLAAREGLIILDVRQVQKRTPNPQVTEVSRLSWPTMSTPQITIPVTIKGDPYLIEMDEFSRDDWVTGAARIIDIANEKKPRVISNIKLEVNMTKNREQVKGDPGAGESFEDGLQGYAGHYCEVPQRDEPGVLACSFILSGLRLFDIRDPVNPKEIAYFNGPAVPAPTSQTQGTGAGANYAMSKPVLVPERGELWYTDGRHGFSVVRVTNGVWPFGRAGGPKDTTDPKPTGTNPKPDPPSGGASGSDEVAGDAIAQAPGGSATPFTGAQMAVFLLIAATAIATGALLATARRRR